MPTDKEVLELAGKAGEILLKNGAEIYRVQDTMTYILNYCHVSNAQVYVISNGIFATVDESGETPYSFVRHVPLGSVHLDRIDAVNTISRRLCQGQLSFDQARSALEKAENLPEASSLGTLAAYGLGCLSFCYLFGGSFFDAIAAFFIGIFLGLSQNFRCFGASKFTRYLLHSGFVTLLSVFALRLFPNLHLNQVVIGAIIPLVPGVMFTNGIRELFNGDYLSGLIHLADALLTAVCIALGVVGAIMLVRQIQGGVFL